MKQNIKDRSQEQPLPKSTPRNNYKSQVLENITVSLEKLSINKDNSIQITPVTQKVKVQNNQNLLIPQTKQGQVQKKIIQLQVEQLKKEKELGNNFPKEMLSNHQKSHHYQAIKVQRNEQQPNKQSLSNKDNHKVVSLPDQQQVQIQQQELIIQHTSRRLSPEREQVQVPARKLVLDQALPQIGMLAKVEKKQQNQISGDNSYFQDQFQEVFSKQALDKQDKQEINLSKQLKVKRTTNQSVQIGNLKQNNHNKKSLIFGQALKQDIKKPKKIQMTDNQNKNGQNLQKEAHSNRIQSLENQKLRQKIYNLQNLNNKKIQQQNKNTISEPQPSFPKHTLVKLSNQIFFQNNQPNLPQISSKNQTHQNQKQNLIDTNYQQQTNQQPNEQDHLTHHLHQKNSDYQQHTQQQNRYYTQLQQQQFLKEQQPQQQKQKLPQFDLKTYQRIQPLLEDLLALLKNSLQIVKQQPRKPKLDLSNNAQNNPPFKFIQTHEQKNSVSKFFKQSRSQSRNKNNPINHSLQNILEKRKINESQSKQNQTQYQIKHQNNSIAQHMNLNKQQRLNFQGGKIKQIPFGLGSLGSNNGLMTEYGFTNKNQYLQKRNDQSQQEGKIIQNKAKINQLLAQSVSTNNKNENYNQIPPRQKVSSFFSQEDKLPQGISHLQQKRYRNQSSFYNDPQFSKNSNAFQGRNMMRSNNFNKIISSLNKNINISTTTQLLFSNKISIEGRQSQQAQRSASFFKRSSKKMIQSEKPTLLTLTPILKVIKRYLQIIAEGHIDNIEAIVGNESNLIGQQMMTTSLNEMIGRKKLFKLSIYFQRAAVVAGICYGYLMVTEERGLFRFQVQNLNSRLFSNDQSNSQNSSPNALKQQTKLILKYMINLVSFCLNNCKLIIKTILTYYLEPKSQERITQRSEKENKKVSAQQQLIEKQIFKRNIQTIKLNLQYIQQTLQKLFSQTYYLAKNYNIHEDFGQSFKNVTKIVNKNSIQESFYTLLEYFSYYLSVSKRQKSIPFLAVAPNPYLDPSQRYTLVIDFISVFCHGTKKSKNFVFRPYSQHFLFQMSQYFDIVVISDALPQQIDKIIDILDPKGIIQHRLYRYHMVEQRLTGRFIKNLERIGRPLERTILLDVEENRIEEDTKNTIFIKEWRGSRHDSALAQLCSVLISIVIENLDCDRASKVIDRQMKMNRQKGIKFINFGLNLKEQVSNQLQKSRNQENDMSLLREQQR